MVEHLIPVMEGEIPQNISAEDFESLAAMYTPEVFGVFRDLVYGVTGGRW
jgi:hypothetical protein